MKKVLYLIFASLLVLGACGNNNSDKQNDKETSINENKPQFKNDTLVLDQAVLKIKDVFIVKNAETNKKEIAIKYEVKNKTDEDEITPGNVWSAGVEVKQEESNTLSSLETGTTILNNGKYKEWLEHSEDTIKKGKTAKGLATYELKNNNKVTLKFNKGVGGKALGQKEYDLSKLKTVNYSSNSDVASNDTIVEMPNKENASNNNVDETKQNNQNETASNSKVEKTQQQNNQQQTQQEHSGGHPSAFSPNGKSDVPVGVEKTDENGDKYIDATGK